MIRFFSFILQITALAAVAIWLADRPGTARIEWHGTVIETSAAFLGLCVAALAVALHLLWRIWHFLRHGPALWRMRRQIDRLRQGQDQLTQGLIAVASGHAAEAGRLAVAARKNIGNPAASQWLQAQAAQLAGDHNAAQALFRALAADPDAAVLGYRGLIGAAKRAGDWHEVERLMGELHARKPATPWLSLMRMESAVRRRQWGEAESALAHAAAARLLDSASGRRMRAALRIAASREAAAGGDTGAALQAAEQAARQAPDGLAALINLAETLAAAGHKRAAMRLIERTWKRYPHPQLARIVVLQSGDALDAFRQTERLCRANENAFASRMALAEAALAADIWGEARRQLIACAVGGSATRGVYKMLAQLERREHGDERAAVAWLLKSCDAAADEAWLCRACGQEHDNWQPVCAACGGFDTIDWQQPGRRTAAVPALQGWSLYD